MIGQQFHIDPATPLSLPATILAKIGEAFQDAVTRAPTPGASERLRELCSLYALTVLERERAWFLEAGSMEPSKSRAIRTRLEAICAEVRPLAGELVRAWGIADEVLDVLDG